MRRLSLVLTVFHSMSRVIFGTARPPATPRSRWARPSVSRPDGRPRRRPGQLLAQARVRQLLDRNAGRRRRARAAGPVTGLVASRPSRRSRAARRSADGSTSGGRWRPRWLRPSRPPSVVRGTRTAVLALALVALTTGVTDRAFADGAYRAVGGVAEGSRAPFARAAARAPRMDTTAVVAAVLLQHADTAASPAIAWRIARAVTREAARSRLPVALLTGVVLVENPELNPRARSSAGATGIMQLMPMHAGRLGCGSSDLESVEVNVCHGTRLLAWLLRENDGHVRRALLRYNGCVKTPGCDRYPGWVLTRAGFAERALLAIHAGPGMVDVPAHPERPRAAGRATTAHASATLSVAFRTP